MVTTTRQQRPQQWMSSADTVARVRALVPLVDLMRHDGVGFSRANHRALKAQCFSPDHDDSNPSLFVWEDEQTFRCFGCGVNGNVIDYVCIRDRLGSPHDKAVFPRALAVLGATDHTMLRQVQPLPPPPPREIEPTEEEYASVALAGDFYREALPFRADALAYLRKRGVGADLAQQLGLGYGRRGLLAALERAGINPQAALDIGLLFSESGDMSTSVRERMFGRVIIPDRAPSGRVRWLTGRAIRSNAARPYLNVKKSKPLFGQEQLVPGTTDIAVVEGPFDWLATQVASIAAVALLGQVTVGQMELLKEYRRVYLMLDADDAGDQMSEKIQKALGASAVPVALPDGAKDVGDVISADPTNGAYLLNRLVRQAAQGALRAA